MNNVIEVKNLSKSYQEHEVIKNISFHVKKGEIFGFLGTNGAGKTTTLECVEGLRKYQTGEIRVSGVIGVQLQNASLPDQMKPLEALRLYSLWKRVSADAELAERFSIDEFANRTYGELSTGQKRRLHLALALIGDPDILFLDEPTAGLDVEGRAAIHKELQQLREREKTVILASHDMAEVEQLCDRISILKDGRIAFCGTPTELTARSSVGGSIHLRTLPALKLDTMKTARIADAERTEQVVQTEDLTLTLAELSRMAEEQKVRIIELFTEQTSLEEKFLTIAKEAAAG